MAAPQSPHETLSCFKAYDIRGRVPEELDAELAFRIGQALALELKAANAVIGHDPRLSGAELSEALAHGLRQAGADVTDIGLCGTEEIYHAVFSQAFDAGVMVTASHNPSDYNGMKFVRSGAVPLSGPNGLFAVKERILKNDLHCSAKTGSYQKADFKPQYIKHLLSYVDTELQPIHILADAGHGSAGPILDLLDRQLPIKLTTLHSRPDGTFPAGVPNPLLPENRTLTSNAVINAGADLGLAWDGDFDRCFFFDDQGSFIEGYYLVGLLAEAILREHPGEKIIHDPRLIWNTQDIVKACHGQAIESKTGHAFIKERMRAEDAVYGGEMSAHHYFREFAYCDSGMIPWLKVLTLMCKTEARLGELLAPRMAKFPCSGEINRRVGDSAAVLREIRSRMKLDALGESHIDGLSMAFANWRFNLRASNTEPLLRLNVESRGDKALMEDRTALLLDIIDQFKEK